MENERGELVDLYVPRKCSATNRIIKAKDHASVQISVAKVDENGRYTGENQTYALCGFVRAMGLERVPISGFLGNGLARIAVEFRKIGQYERFDGYPRLYTNQLMV
ncbi:hypothetical protein Vi05172_g7432 [Venturia inaequalis]|nr:hypothetical protein Vi05172_g7432 [Venturia inaequalis]